MIAGPCSNRILRFRIVIGLRVAVAVLSTLVCWLPAGGAQYLDAVPSTGMVQGRVVQLPGIEPATQIFVENLQSGFVAVVPVSADSGSFSAEVPPGDYQLYTWLPDFSSMGGHTSCTVDPACDGHDLLTVTIRDDEDVRGIDLDDWFTPDSPLLVLGGRLIDGTGAEPVDDAVVVIWDGHVMAAGPAAEMAVVAARRPVAPAGSTILPGFINAHVHNAFDEENPSRWAYAGVTTVRDVGAPVGLRWDEIRSGFEDDLGRARVLASGPLVTCPGGYPIAGNGFPSLTVDSVNEAGREINDLIDRGADVIKIVIESGVGNLLSRELATAIVDTAHARNVPVTVHLTRLQDLRTALDAGVDDIAHMVVDYVPDSVIERMVEDEVGWVPTMVAVGGFPATTSSNLQRFLAAGGTVALGNDAGYLRGLVIGMPLPEILRMEQAGMGAMEIIVAATRDAAAVCRVGGKLGTLEVGNIADILMVRGNPLLDLRALENVQMVVHHGEVIRDRAAMPRRSGGRRTIRTSTGRAASASTSVDDVWWPILSDEILSPNNQPQTAVVALDQGPTRRRVNPQSIGDP